MNKEEIRYKNLEMAKELSNTKTIDDILKIAEQLNQYSFHEAPETDQYEFYNSFQIQHPIKKSIPFHLWNYQKMIVDALRNERQLLVLHATQIGVTMLSCAYVCEVAKQTKKTIQVFTHKRLVAEDISSRIKFGCPDDIDTSLIKINYGEPKDIDALKSCEMIWIDDAALLSHSLLTKLLSAIKRFDIPFLITSVPAAPTGPLYDISQNAICLKMPYFVRPGLEIQLPKDATDEIIQRKYLANFY